MTEAPTANHYRKEFAKRKESSDLNMGGGEDVWQIYYENAPEMKLIRETLTRSTDRRE